MLYAILLYIYGQVLNRATAEDLTADVFVAVAMHLGQFDSSRGNMLPWILTIARNLTQNYRLRPSTRLEESRDELPERFADAPEARDDSLRVPENIRTERILAQLSDEERSFLELRYVLEVELHPMIFMPGEYDELLELKRVLSSPETTLVILKK